MCIYCFYQYHDTFCDKHMKWFLVIFIKTFPEINKFWWGCEKKRHLWELLHLVSALGKYGALFPPPFPSIPPQSIPNYPLPKYHAIVGKNKAIACPKFTPLPLLLFKNIFLPLKSIICGSPPLLTFDMCPFLRIIVPSFSLYWTDGKNKHIFCAFWFLI